jgi:hypothetical protein
MKLYDFEVRHPSYPTVTVSSIGPDSATMTAAKERWGLTTGEWATIAASCTVRKVGETLKPRCRRCGKEITEAGLCQTCEQLEAAMRRDMARMRTPDRRAGFRERARKGDYYG